MVWKSNGGNMSKKRSHRTPSTTATTTTAEPTTQLPPNRRRRPPPTYASSYPTTSTLPISGTATSACSSFVFGGMHYPGKDKKRRRSLLYRVCFSSPQRILVTVLVGSYILVQYGLRPLGKLLVQRWGIWLATDVGSTIGSAAEEGFFMDHLPTVKEEQQWEQQRRHYQTKRHTRPGIPILSSKRYVQALRGIVPDWLPGATAGMQQDEEHNQPQPKEGALQPQHIPQPQAPPPWQQEDDASANVALEGDEEAAAEAAEESVRLLTLHDMDTSGTCPPLTTNVTPSVTLVLQSTVDRLWLLKETCQRWTDPILLVVYHDPNTNHNSKNNNINHHNDDEPWQQVMDWDTACPQLTLLPYHPPPTNPNFQDDDDDATTTTHHHDALWRYPINHLRNIGLAHITTTHFLVVDIDFIPSTTLVSILHDNLQFVQGGREALIVPAFERHAPPTNHNHNQPCRTPQECEDLMEQTPKFVPSHLQELQECMQTKECSVFQAGNNWEGHYTTMSHLWLQGEKHEEYWYEEVEEEAVHGGGVVVERRKVPRRVECFHSFRYEPYVVLRWCNHNHNHNIINDNHYKQEEQKKPQSTSTPYYDERFYGYGKNKISYISHLRFLHYTFSILPQGGFIIHVPHPPSKAKESWLVNEDGHGLHVEMDALYPQFLKELVGRYGSPEIGQCQRLNVKKR